ncbi:MAG: hypothetical protein JWO33_1006 [Caulobacteraceae bacterium]|nr:hypothetical protein [Caulobacteraceae bacterium]
MRRRMGDQRVPTTHTLSTGAAARAARPPPRFSRERPAPAIPYRAIGVRIGGVGLLIGAAIFGPALIAGRAHLAAPPPIHWPALGLVGHAPLAVQAHLATLAGAVSVGAVLMMGVKGTWLHRVLGWAWSVFMLATAVVTLFIPTTLGLHLWRFGPLHLFSFAVVTLVPLAIWSARRGRLVAHGRTMTIIFLGTLVIAGALAFAPGRLMWKVLFG